MEHIIKQILQIDAQAKEKLEEARQHRDELMAQVDTEAAAETEKFRKHCEEKIAMIQKTEEENAREQMAEIQRQADSQVSALERQFAANEAKWLDEIAADVTGR
ncbi:MAG: hypothetical protein ACOX6P_00875 [Candidatus Merdivicinus sp.]|jgi:hypothetical protein